MESRKITVVSNKNSQKVVINTTVETLGALKKEFTKHGISYNSESAFYEGVSKTELLADDSILPANVPYKDPKTKTTVITNDLVIMVTVKDKKIKSGAMSRSDLYAKAKELNMGEAIKAKFGKNYTQVSSSDLEAFLTSGASSKKEVLKKVVAEAPKANVKACVEKPEVAEKAAEAPKAKEIVTKVPATTDVIADLQKKVQGLETAFKGLVNVLEGQDTIDSDEVEDILSSLNDEAEAIAAAASSDATGGSYSDRDISNMFSGIIK